MPTIKRPGHLLEGGAYYIVFEFGRLLEEGGAYYIVFEFKGKKRKKTSI